jgi:hypothetical protein
MLGSCYTATIGDVHDHPHQISVRCEPAGEVLVTDETDDERELAMALSGLPSVP